MTTSRLSAPQKLRQKSAPGHVTGAQTRVLDMWGWGTGQPGLTPTVLNLRGPSSPCWSAGLCPVAEGPGLVLAVSPVRWVPPSACPSLALCSLGASQPLPGSRPPPLHDSDRGGSSDAETLGSGRF